MVSEVIEENEEEDGGGLEFDGGSPMMAHG